MVDLRGLANDFWSKRKANIKNYSLIFNLRNWMNIGVLLL